LRFWGTARRIGEGGESWRFQVKNRRAGNTIGMSNAASVKMSKL